MTFASEKQQSLFAALTNCGEMVFACGPRGVSVNLVGHFSIAKNESQQDQLNVGDGTHHVHIDWKRVKRAELNEFHGEGVLSFFDGDEPLFKFYRFDGPFPEEVTKLIGGMLF